MQQFRCDGDDRNKGFCVHCGGPSETIDHVPSKVLLDEPYPENLMAAPACRFETVGTHKMPRNPARLGEATNENAQPGTVGR